LLDGISHASLATAILDFANYATRERRISPHPAAERVQRLISLLHDVVRRLSELEEDLHKNVATAELGEKVSQGVSLAVSLCDALALIGDQRAVPVLENALAVGHRRMRTEAAAALARLGQERGIKELANMAVEPVARLRVIAYAEELDILDRLDETYLTPQSKAEAELALYLAEPTQFGLPPTDCELVDCREQYWPGYDEPVECFLFRFGYRFGENAYSNIGIAGPLACAFTADLADLAPNDIYAAFAGWQAEHDEIYEVPVEQLGEIQRVEVARLERRLKDAGYRSVTPLMLGSFFGGKVLIAVAARDGTPGLAVADANESFWYPTRQSGRSLGPAEVYSIYKGRKLLRAFNP
jgi:hypothetical protein